MLRLSLSFFWWFASFRSRHALARELLALRQQVGVLKRMNPFSRIAVCGLISQYNVAEPYGVKNLASILGQFGHRVSAAQNLVVLQSELGSAPAIARALDRLEHPKIVGTLAGDDTCLVITRGPKDALAVARELSSAIE